MEYRRIRISYEDGKDRFYRVLDIRNDLNLVYAGIIFCSSLGCEFVHHFMFRYEKQAYVPESFMGDSFTGWKPMKEHSLKELGESFIFEYDTGDGWGFICETVSLFEKDDMAFAYLIDGKGQGIWEDNRYSLDRYLEGKVAADASCSEEDELIQLPWNYENDCFGDFDDYDPGEEAELFEDFFLSDINEYLHNCHLNGFEKEIRYVDPELYFSKEVPFVRNMDIYDDEIPFFTDEVKETGDEYNDELDFLADSFVEMQLDSYFLVKELMEHFRLLYPEKDEDELIEMIRDELMDEAFSSLENYLKQLSDSTLPDGNEEEYH